MEISNRGIESQKAIRQPQLENVAGAMVKRLMPMTIKANIIGISRFTMAPATFSSWGWRIAFWLSIPLLLISIYIRLKLNESPIFRRMKSQGKASKSPLTDSFFKYPNNKYVALALFGATAGQGVVWYTGQFYALFFLQIYLKLDYIPTYLLIGTSLVIGTPFFLLFGALS